jgi:penicillin-binding protein 1A
VTPLQLAAAYSVFANGGYRVTPYLIDHVTDSDGKVIMQAKPTQAGDESIRAIDPRVDYIMNNLLEGVATYGTGARAHAVLKRIVAGKTGTTNDSMDAWFSGYTSGLEATAWLGYDQPKSLGARETGGGVALPIWLGYMQETVKNLPMPTPRPKPDGVIEANNELYLSDYPPGQAVASLGLGGNSQTTDAGPAQPDSLGDFLNNLAGNSKVSH